MIKVLLVDDEQAIRSLCSRILTGLGYQVVTAPSGEAALDIFGKESFDIILTDLNMGHGMDGMKFAKMIRDLGSSVPVILHTSRPPDFDLPPYLSGLLIKPVSTLNYASMMAIYLKKDKSP